VLECRYDLRPDDIRHDRWLFQQLWQCRRQSAPIVKGQVFHSLDELL
jgi:hypothetical protein